jgi:hypothetical protein
MAKAAFAPANVATETEKTGLGKRISLLLVKKMGRRTLTLGYAVAVHRTLAFGFSAFLAALAGVLLVWWQGQISPGDIGLPATILRPVSFMDNFATYNRPVLDGGGS